MLPYKLCALLVYDLFDFQTKDIWEFDVPEKLDQLSIYKDKGNDYYKVGAILCGRFTFERIHNTKEQIYFYERVEDRKAKERMFKSFK